MAIQVLEARTFGGHLLRSIRLVVSVALAVGLPTVLGTSPALGVETKTFTGQKNCSTAVTISPPAPGGYCLITQSSLKILRGQRLLHECHGRRGGPYGSSNAQGHR
jgi:hypothetical protein